MKEDLRLQLRGVSGLAEGKNRVREYLQARMLASLQRSGAMIPLAFQGGTALRFLYAIRRYAEDLGFAWSVWTAATTFDRIFGPSKPT